MIYKERLKETVKKCIILAMRYPTEFNLWMQGEESRAKNKEQKISQPMRDAATLDLWGKYFRLA